MSRRKYGPGRVILKAEKRRFVMPELVGLAGVLFVLLNCRFIICPAAGVGRTRSNLVVFVPESYWRF